ncbi:MAG: hypothetical protein GWM92_13125 [Gemmatimonadetes bacterium]|nr:hypothetical protein [Gemmatimonadota bacterium]NIR79639.1 hypothetical protein [Gemmatimonadota bacterium]NIT88339.1 hypothetical protein [Gemmatimonadota bacterium]NIU32148.1 hypothetical protein [Gemmatimonadota bacterium]NIU36716.1 hypothetical protein [Gemmatimonadota bacterium]
MLVENRRSARRFVWTLVLGLFLGGLFSKLAELFLPVSAARDFLTTSVAASIGPFSVDLVAVSFTIGPLTLTMNVLTLVGIGIVALIVRSWI